MRVFVIGVNKTGTTSLDTALRILGYQVAGFDGELTREYLQSGEIEPILDAAKPFTGFNDLPWAAVFEQLDQEFPGSRFILTERSAENWYQSFTRFYTNWSIDYMCRAMLGVKAPEGYGDLDEQAKLDLKEFFLASYRRRNDYIKTYFKDRPNDLLCFQLRKDENPWKPLCEFLGKPVPPFAFPHRNRNPRNPLLRFLVRYVRTPLVQLKMMLVKWGLLKPGWSLYSSVKRLQYRLNLRGTKPAPPSNTTDAKRNMP